MLTTNTMPHAVIIGAGLGGLAAAIRLGARGYKVTVVERLSSPGGRARVFKQDGFTFDAGPTIITAPFVLEELWAFAGRKFQDDVKLKALEPFYTIRFDDGSTFTNQTDRAAMRTEIARIAPDDVAGYEGFMRESEATYKFAETESLAIGLCACSQPCETPEAAHGAELPSALCRRQSVSCHKCLQHDRLSRAAVWGALRHGWNRRHRASHGKVDCEPGR
jgi:phytoene desaturase